MSALSDIGLVDVTAAPYNADNTGVADATSDIQDAMDYAYPNEMAVFFPAGTYRITDTLLGITEENNQRERAHLLIGSTAGTRPLLKLDSSATGFNDTGNPKAVVHIYTPTDEEAPDPDDEKGSMGFNNGMRGVDIEVGTGNAGAVGLRFNGAQDCIVENVKITMNSGYAGMYNMVGTNAVIQNIEVVGGKYGIITDSNQGSQWPTITGLRMSGQTDYSIYDMQTVSTIVGFEITKDDAPVFFVDDASWNQSYSGGSLTLIDGSIEVKEEPVPILDDQKGRSVVMKNVFLKSGNTTWFRLNEYASTIKKLSDVDGRQIGRTLIDGVEEYDDISSSVQYLPEPPNLISQHITDVADYPSPDVILEAIENGELINGMTVVNVKDCGVVGAPTGADDSSRAGTDDTVALQAVIDAYDIVFLPKGKYLTTATLTLNADTHLIGVTNYMSEIRPHEDWKPTEPASIIRTVDSATAKTKISHMKIGYATETEYDWFTALDWRVGRDSVVKGIMIRPLWNWKEGGNPKNDVLITGNGGGRFYGLDSHANGNRTQHPGHRRLQIVDTCEPLILYGLNVEDGNGDWQAEITNATNVAIYGYKTEDGRALLVLGSDNIVAFGIGGSAEVRVADSENVYMGNIAIKRWTKFGTTDTLDDVKVLTEVYNGQTIEFGADRIISLFKRGVADFDVFRPEPVTPPEPPPEPGTKIEIVLYPDGTYEMSETATV